MKKNPKKRYYRILYRMTRNQRICASVETQSHVLCGIASKGVISLEAYLESIAFDKYGMPDYQTHTYRVDFVSCKHCLRNKNYTTWAQSEVLRMLSRTKL